MDWKYKSSTRVPPLKAQSPEFKTPVSPTKKKRRISSYDVTGTWFTKIFAQEQNDRHEVIH
jgi:hypothetical protein